MKYIAIGHNQNDYDIDGIQLCGGDSIMASKKEKMEIFVDGILLKAVTTKMDILNHFDMIVVWRYQ